MGGSDLFLLYNKKNFLLPKSYVHRYIYEYIYIYIFQYNSTAAFPLLFEAYDFKSANWRLWNISMDRNDCG